MAQYTTPPKPSQLDPNASIGSLAVQLDVDSLFKSRNHDIEGILAFQRLANYLSAAQIFLQSNALLEEPLTKDNVKPRLLGHWGTCGGLNLTYTHATALISRHEQAGEDVQILYITGPGHGAPAILSVLYLEGTITRFYPQYQLNKSGVEKFVKAFSWPGGFPSHVNAETPGAIHEGGELGYALAVAYGAVMDKPNLITVAVIGDGESETGPTATAWHAHKFIDPKESGAVLPILHLNGYKISERTVPGTMDDLELAALFTGYGYQVRFVEYGPLAESKEEEKRKEYELNVNTAVSLEWAYEEIRKIQKAARSGNPITKPRWPIIILRTPKGYTGPRSVDGLPVLGSFRAHQVPLPAAKTDDKQLASLGEWLKSYDVTPLIVGDRGQSEKVSRLPGDVHPEALFSHTALRILPKKVERRIGMIKESYAGYEPLDVPAFEDFVDTSKKEQSPMKAVGAYLVEVVKRNPTTFRIFSPDELGSNKLDKVFDVTHRLFQWDPETAHAGGRVVEMLSEHTLQGFLQGYSLTGRTGLFPSYEAFLGIVTTMVQQYAKFAKIAVETNWRTDVPSLNYIMTSTLWRQEHNGYSHQNPGFIGSLLTLPRSMVRVYLPPDAATAVSVIAHCLRSKNYVNLIIGSKADTPAYLTVEETDRHCIAGVSVWKKYSTDGGINPDVVLVGIGVETTAEIIAAASLLKKEGVRVRVINVIDLMVLGEYGSHPHALSKESFEGLFGTDTPVVINFHGYPAHVKALLFERNQSITRKRFEVLGYIEEGTTTTPWSMLRLNKAGRFDIVDNAIGLISVANPNGPIAVKGHELRSWCQHMNRTYEKYAVQHGIDSPELHAGTVLFEA
ncbi:phosphoketolase [Cantharellus anzutake]|uniref:phosphoketolase n=1 Tax=Cantharellus anzutake TaxID=1750568 RepID=UPI001908ECC0|nr:phosphoketolase [Cantharellus anzutake]KAF8331506.1 phosphoketolase [Cantharellus anzutake]